MPGQQGSGGSGEGMSNEELAEMLLSALMNMDREQLRQLAAMAVARFAGMEPGRPVGGTYYLYRTLRQLDYDGLAARMMERGAQGGEGEPGDERRDDPLADRFQREEFEAPPAASSASWSRRRSAAGWWPTAASRRWPARCASRCPRTSTSCTRRARRCSSSSGRSSR